MPGVDVSTSSLTKKDIADLRFGLELGIDFVALSFVRKRDDVLKLRLYLEEADSHVPILVLLDLRLPKVDGIDVLRQARSSETVWKQVLLSS